MNDPLRLLVQGFLSKKFMTEEELNQKIELLQRSYGLESDLLKSVRAINKRLEPLSLRLQKARSEDKGQLYYGLVNLREDEAAKLGAEYGQVERQFFKDCLQAILICETGEVSSIELLGVNITIGGGAQEGDRKGEYVGEVYKGRLAQQCSWQVLPRAPDSLRAVPSFLRHSCG